MSSSQDDATNREDEPQQPTIWLPESWKKEEEPVADCLTLLPLVPQPKENMSEIGHLSVAFGSSRDDRSFLAVVAQPETRAIDDPIPKAAVERDTAYLKIPEPSDNLGLVSIVRRDFRKPSNLYQRNLPRP